jgi:hypothetical protein
MILVIKQCKICGCIRKFVKDTPRDIERVCGNCWDWNKYPSKESVEYIDDIKNYKPKYGEL